MSSWTSPDSTSLEKPLAIATEYLLDRPPATSIPAQMETNGDTSSMTEDGPAIATAESKRRSPEKQPSQLPEPLQRYSFWKYPALARFSSSAPTSLASSPVKVPGLTLAPEEDARGSSALPSPVKSPIKSMTPIVTTDGQFRPIVSLPGLVIACLVCLLLGSLLRSILSEADFVIYKERGVEAGNVVPDGETWRELKRLMEWRIGWNRDLIVAIARRR